MRDFSCFSCTCLNPRLLLRPVFRCHQFSRRDLRPGIKTLILGLSHPGRGGPRPDSVTGPTEASFGSTTDTSLPETTLHIHSPHPPGVHLLGSVVPTLPTGSFGEDSDTDGTPPGGNKRI